MENQHKGTGWARTSLDLEKVLKLHNQGIDNYTIAKRLQCSESSVRKALKRAKEAA